MLRYCLLDLDDTLYTARCGLWPAIGRRIDLYMVERLGLPAHRVAEQRRQYLEAFGTTLNGLRHEFGVDPQEYLAFVHDLPLEEYLQASPQLDQMLARLPLEKVVLTNADAPHAERVLACLGIAHHFKQIIDIQALEFVAKPAREAFERALALVGAQANECVFVDDAIRNLRGARGMGLLAFHVTDGRPHGAEPGIEQISCILDLEAALGPWLSPQPRLGQVAVSVVGEPAAPGQAQAP